MDVTLLLTLLACHAVAGLFSYEPPRREQQVLSNLQLLIPGDKESGAGEGAGEGVRGGELPGSWYRPRVDAPGGLYENSIPYSTHRVQEGKDAASPSFRDRIFVTKNGANDDEASYELTYYNPPEREQSSEYRIEQLPFINYDGARYEINPIRAYTKESERSEESDGYESDRDTDSVGELCTQLVQGGDGLGILGLHLIQYLCMEHIQRDVDESCSHHLPEIASHQQRTPAPARYSAPLPFTMFRPPNGRRYWNVLSEEYPGQMKQYVGIVNRQRSKRMAGT